MPFHLKKNVFICMLCVVMLTTVGCKKAVDIELKKEAPAAKETSYTQALYELGRMTRKFGISKVYVQSKGVMDDTGTSAATGGEIPYDITEMVKSSINRIGGSIVFVPYDPIFLKNQAGLNFTSLEGKAKPDVVVTGGITEFDRSLESGQQGFDAGGTFGDVGVDIGNQDRDSMSSISLDMNLIDFDSMAMIPRMQAVNSMKVFKAARDTEVGFSIMGAAFGFKGSVKKIQGRHAAVRVLVELSVVEILGKYLNLPYWKCMEGSSPDPIVLETIRDRYNESSNAERVMMMQRLLRVYGFRDVKQTGTMDQQTRVALQTVSRAYNFQATSLDDDFYEALFVNAPAASYETSKVGKGGSSGGDYLSLGGSAPAAAPAQKVQASAGPIQVDVWTTKDTYRENENIVVKFKADRDFYGKVVYRTVDGSLVQILPNDYNSRDFFKGGQEYTIPGPEDQFALTVAPPFGEEQVIVYASDSPLMDVNKVAISQGLSTIPGNAKDVDKKVRAISLGATPKKETVVKKVHSLRTSR